MIAVVTGAGSGIGRAVARHLAASGAAVAVLDRNADGAAAVAQELGTPAIAVVTDIGDPAAVASSFATVDTSLGAMGVLVACAGITTGVPALDMTPEAWRAVIDANLTGTFFCCQQAAQRMAKRGSGAIVIVSSVTGIAGVSTRAAYAASKGGLIALTRTLAVEWGPLGIRVNCVAPGAIDTPLAAVHHAGPGAAIRARYLARTPLGRYGTVAEVAEAVAFLASNAASYIDGHVLATDGGYLATGMMF